MGQKKVSYSINMLDFLYTGVIKRCTILLINQTINNNDAFRYKSKYYKIYDQLKLRGKRRFRI
jgi:hypothetical protein